MKQLERINFRHSFAAKTCLWMLATSACVFVVCFGIALWFASNMMLDDGHKKANLELDKAILYVTDEMNTVECAGNNFAAFWNKGRDLQPEAVYAAFRDFLKTNPKVKGVAIGFEPGVYPAYKKGFAPYIMRQDNGKMTEANLADIHNFYKKDWYNRTKSRKTPYWSNPFTEVNGNIICSYCLPIVTPDNKFIGVLAIDMSLAELTEKVQSVKPYKKSFLTIMDRNLNFVVHPDKKLILKGNPMQILDKNKYEVNETIFVDIRNQVRGIGAFGDRGYQKYLYYAPIKRAGWTVTLECDKDEITAGVNAVRWQMAAISILGIFGLMFVCLFLMRKFLRPIKLYSNAALHIAEGNFHTRMPHMHDHNELWALGNSLDHMQHSLDKYIQELKDTTQEKGRIESELNIASKIQMSMIPKIFPPYPDRDDTDIYGTLIPAKAVGGDLYDFFLRDEKLFFCVGDVSGKGVPASLVMAVTRSLLRIVAAQESRPERIVASLNNSMSDMNESNMFVTLFVGVLDLPTGRFRYCNAGHNAPVVINSTGEVKMLEVTPNLPVAIMPDMKFEMQETVITPGTSIFMYTDGLTEAEDENKKLFGEERMTEILKDMTDKTSKEQIEGMLDAVHQHVKNAEQSDDLTMISIKYQRKQRETKFYRKLTLHNNIRETPKIADFMDDIVGETGIDMALANSLNLALEEAVVNVMNYAYPKEQTGNIEIEAYTDKNCIRFIITDNGIPFDPTTDDTEPDITADIEERSIGGLGIFLVTHLMDTVAYKRNDDKNVLTLTKMLDTSKK